MLLGLLVVGLADGRIDRRSREHEPGALHLVGGGRPVAVEAHELGAEDEASAAEHEVGLRGTPLRERGRPFLRPPHVEDRVAVFDGRAVHHPGHRRRHLAGRHPGHRLVEEADAAVALAHRDQRLAAPQPPERRQVGVTEALGDRGDLLVRLECRLVIVLSFQLPKADRDQEVAGLDGLAPRLLDQLGGTAEPRTGLGNLAAEREAHAGPPAGSGCAFELARRRADGEPAHPGLQRRHRRAR